MAKEYLLLAFSQMSNEQTFPIPNPEQRKYDEYVVIREQWKESGKGYFKSNEAEWRTTCQPAMPFC
jgi:hypothetical protein